MSNTPRALLISLFCLLSTPLQALTVDTPLPDPAQEARAQELFTQIRCAVCKSQSLADSSAEVATDMRHEIRVQVREGNSDEAIITFLVQRYGESIRMKPELNTQTAILWFAPFVVLLSAGLFVLGYFRKRSQQ